MMRKLLALGDSHLEALQLASELRLLSSDTDEFCIVPGATAVGLRNPNSLTDALNIFRDALAKQAKDTHVLLHLGEVDCGFVIWWRAMKYGETVNRQFKESLLAYMDFVLYVRGLGFEKICITGASLPTIRDGIDFGEVANKRAEISVDLGSRTGLTLEYNAALKTFASRSSFHYFDISDAVLDRSQRVVSDYFRNPNPVDHHLDKSKVAGIWASTCNRFLET